MEAVVDDAADIEHVGRRPDDRLGLHALGQLPLDLGGLAGIAGILPVGVPVLADCFAQSNPEGLARFHLGDFGDELGAHILRLHDGGCGGLRPSRHGKQEGKKERKET